MARYTVYQGAFACHSCKENVPSIRFYPISKEVTWMCSSKHLNNVSLQTRKSKRDYERKV
jgi:hypothetical protein